MRIVFIGSFKKLWDEEGAAKSLEYLGHEVERIDEGQFDLSQGKKIFSNRPDFILFAKFKSEFYQKKQFLNACKGKIKTICWIPDLYFGLGREVKMKQEPIFKSDLVLTPDGGHDNEFKALGINHKLLRQGIYHEYCNIHPRVGLETEIVFVGTANGEFPYRQKLCQFLAHKYKKFEWIGVHDSETIRGEDLNRLYANTKIIVGDSVHSPKYWSNRIYETLGRGGFLIHPHIEGLDKEFKYYKDFIPYQYGDFEGLGQKIDYFLEHEDERKKISKHGFETVKKNYTLINRCKQLIKYASTLR